MALHWIDLTIVAVYFVGVVGFGLWLARREGQTEDDYFAAGRKLGWFTIGASLFASNISSEHLIGLAGDGFLTGFAVGNYEWGATIILVVLATVFVPFYVGSRIRTIPEYLERRFGTGSRMYLSILTILANVLVRISVALYAGALVMQELFGVPLWIAVFLLAITTVLYTAAGGLAAVVYTDAVQAAVLLVGSVVLTVLALDKVGGIGVLIESVPASTFDMVRPADDPTMPWPGLLIGVPILGVWYWCTDQVIVQRVLGARGIHQARMGALFAAALKILPVFLFVLPGVCASVLYPDIEAKTAFPTLVRELLPVGLKGLVAAGLIAALMSSIDSTLNSTGTLVSLDFYQRFKKNTSSADVVRIGRITTVIVMGFGIAWVLVVEREESLFQYLQKVNAAISPPIAACFVIGVFWRRINHAGVMSALVAGLAVGVTLLILDPMPFLISAGVTFAFSAVLLVVVSLLTPPPKPAQVEGLTWPDVRAIVEQETTPRQRTTFRVLAAILVVTMAGLWLGFSGLFFDDDDDRAAEVAPDPEDPDPDRSASDAEPELAFGIDEGSFENRFYRRGPVAAHVVTRSGETPRVAVAFPAGNSGVALFADAPAELRLSETVDEAVDGDLRGVRFSVSTDAPTLTWSTIVLGSIRVIRDVGYGRPLPDGAGSERDGLVWTRDRLDGGAQYRLEIVPTEGTEATFDAERLALARADGVRFDVVAQTSEPPLTPLPFDRVLVPGAGTDERARRALAFLSYEEKLLAGSWRFLTYFGRDTLLSARLLMPMMTPDASEAALGSVIERLSPSGAVAHEEDIGDFAALRRTRDEALRGTGELADPIFVYEMIDDDMMLAPVLAHYVLDSGHDDRAEAFLARTTASGETYRERVETNLRYVLERARPYAQVPRLSNLLSLYEGLLHGQWRDSREGLGAGRIPYDVNVVLVPAALDAAARLFESGLVRGDPEEARRLADGWRDVSRHFEVRIPADEAAARVEAYAREVGLPPASPPGSEVVFPALALDADGRPIRVLHSDEGFRLLFSRPDAEELEAIAHRLSTPFPLGLSTPVGMVVSNPVYVEDDALRATFGRSFYHGTVVWSWQQALAVVGIRRQLARDDLSAGARSALEAAERRLWEGIEGSAEMRTSELWSFEIDGGAFRIEPFGRAGHESESNAAQLWSTVFLAIER